MALVKIPNANIFDTYSILCDYGGEFNDRRHFQKSIHCNPESTMPKLH